MLTGLALYTVGVAVFLTIPPQALA